MEKKKIHFGIFISISVALLIFLFILTNQFTSKIIEFEALQENSNEDYCTLNSGKWLSEYNECEGISRTACEQTGGFFEECASACRHNPDAEICIAMCVAVCKYQ